MKIRVMTKTGIVDNSVYMWYIKLLNYHTNHKLTVLCTH